VAINSYPWDGGPNMTEAEWRQLWRSQADGFTDVGSLTLSNSNGDVTLSSARGVLQGAEFIQSGSDTVTLTAVPSGQSRIDYVVLRYNPTANTVSLQTVIGTPGSTGTEPLLEPFRTSGGNLLTGLYDMPVARFTGGPGTAQQRGMDMRLRTTRTFFIPDAIRSFSTVNERHGDIRHEPDGSFWFDQNSGASGQWRRITDTPEPTWTVVEATASEIHGGFGSTYVPGSPQCSVSFVPGTSEAVKITFGGLIYVASNGNRCALSIQVRQGSTEILGPHIKRALVAGEAVTDGGEAYASGDRYVILTNADGLQQGVTFTARTMHWASVTGAGHILARNVLVEHITPVDGSNLP
jgi:hypothetical protein